MQHPTRRTHLDALKIIASQLVVLHHFSAYGPVADAASLAAPGLMSWLYEYARMAVQVFLVLRGYLAVQSLTVATRAQTSLVVTLLRRYQRLVLPFLVALLLAVVSAALARRWLMDDFIPAAPNWRQALAHLFLLQGVLEADALSAGVWYVAIDFQLFVLLALLLWLGYRAGQVMRLAQALVLVLMLASLFFFNRRESLDIWALYFFGSYGLGAAACWAGAERRPGIWLTLLAAVGLLALANDFRLRIALALAVALLLGVAQWQQPATQGPAKPLARLVHQLGQSSYALFLLHFPVLMLGNALFARLGLSGPQAGLGMLLACWSGSMLAAFWFERGVEAPLARLAVPRNKGSTKDAAPRPVQSTSPRTR
jgi:peptidoglycan/LPS O-acetylase OafA/YrhL